MSIETKLETETGPALVYEVRIMGHLGAEWADWFGGLTVTLEDNGETLLTGPVADQAALHGLLKKVRDLGTLLLSVNRVPSRAAGAADEEQLIGFCSKVSTSNSGKNAL